MTHRVVSDYTRADGAETSNIKVYVRARPPDEYLLNTAAIEETKAKVPFDQAKETAAKDFLVHDTGDERKLSIKDPDTSNRRYGEVSFQFDKVFWTAAAQEEVFNDVCKTQVEHCLDGYNSCCFAYGQTGSGKTYTMFGTEGEVRGLIPRSVEYLFSALGKRVAQYEVAMVCSFLEIYNDQIRDLGKAYMVAMGAANSDSLAMYEKTSDIFENLAGKRGNPYFAPAFHKQGSAMAEQAETRPEVKAAADEYNTLNYEIREDNEGNVFVKDLSMVPVTTIDEVLSLINTGMRVRATHETKMNATSSRSHTIFTVTLLQRDKITGQSSTSMLNLVDLAGSERIKKSESQGIRLKEALHINSSLTALGKVVMALDSSHDVVHGHVPYRDSKLTRVLQNSLGGNSYTSVIATIQIHPNYYEECLSTLQFANRCRNVKNNPKVNYVEDTEDKDRRIKKLMEELGAMRQKMSNGGPSAKGGIGGGVGSGLSGTALISILRKMGINAVAGPDGTITVNSKKFTLEELDLGGSLNEGSAAETTTSRAPSKDHLAGTSSAVVEKLNKMIKDLKESNSGYMTKAKERKSEMEEQGRELQRTTNELVKANLTIRHKEFEYNELMSEKERVIVEQKKFLEISKAEEIHRVLNKNSMMLKQQQEMVDQLPDALKEFTVLLQNGVKEKKAYEVPLRLEFERHLKKLETSRVFEIDNIRKQYTHYLLDKDRALSGFVETFNKYRTKKSEQLRMAEREIVRLYDYTAKIEQILEDAEAGKFQIVQHQGNKSRGTAYGPGATNPDGPGCLLLPQGMKPTNPMKLKISSQNNGLDLTKKIVEKHKERLEKMERMKEEAFRKSLHYAAKTTATATGSLDEALQMQVRELLVSKDNILTSHRKHGKGKAVTQTPTAPGIYDFAPDSSPGNNNGSTSRPTTSPMVRPTTSPMPSGRAGKKSSTGLLPVHATAPGGAWDKMNQSSPIPGPNTNPETGPTMDTILMAELEELRARVNMEDITTERVLAELSSNDTLLYIQQLENEVDILRSQVRQTAQLAQNTKIVNGSLTRTTMFPPTVKK